MYGPDKGDGSLSECRRLARDLGVVGRISISGIVPKSGVPDALDSGDIFVNTSQIDNTPVSVMEAMACGMCVVSTNVGGIPYLLRHDIDALLIPPNDEIALAAAARRLLTEPGLAQRLSAHARERAAEWDWSHVLPRWEGLLCEVARGRFNA
jgi:glycosyltransferase involved in cell wall biosynthesis